MRSSTTSRRRTRSAVATAEHWGATTGALFDGADYHRHDDPFDRVMGYLDLREALVHGEAASYTCLVGTMVQESYETHPAVRAACEASIFGHSATLEPEFAALIEDRGAPPGVTARSLAVHIQTVLQGALVLAKAADDAAVVLEAIAHLRRYFECMFTPVSTTREQS